MIKVVKMWYENDKRKLIELYQLGYTFPEIAVKMDRTRFAVESEMHLLRRQGRVGYRTIESEAAANKRWLSFEPKSVEFENNGPSDKGSEQAERAERKAITTEDQMTDINQNDCPDIIRDAMTAKSARANTIFNEILENII